MKKYMYWLLCSTFLLALLLLCAKADHTEHSLKFRIEQGSNHTEISVFESDGQHYVFLPSYASMSAVKIVLPASWEASLGGIPIANEMCCEEFALETPYSLIINNEYVAELLFYQSANVATMYVDTLSKSMDFIHEDKNHSETAAVTLYTKEGTVNLSSDMASIKGRGNGTWRSPGKRPYLLTLSAAADLLEMGAAKKWVLIANAYDVTNLNNKLVMDLARETGLSWSPEGKYVDLYLNGEYAGLYLLCEKVETGTSRLNIDLNSGDYLCRNEATDRWDILKNPIRSQSGRTIEITNSSTLTEDSKASIIESVNAMEQTIMSGSDLTEAENFDLDSWVRKYIIDEVVANTDSDFNSSYFYYSDGVFYGGPIWDYDLAFGNSNLGNQNPTAFVAKNAYKSEYIQAPYYSALYANESFYNRMVEIYQSEFLPVLNQLIEGGITELAAEIQPAVTMNFLRWRPGGGTAEKRLSYLKDRVSFLNSAWIDKTEYCTLQFEASHGAMYWNISVEKGTLLVTDDVDLENTTWINRETGKEVDFSQPIMSDMRLIIVQPEQEQVQPEQALPEQTPPTQAEPTKSLATRDYVVILSVMVLLTLFITLGFIDIQQRKKERMAANESR